MKGVPKKIQERQCLLFDQADSAYGKGVGELLRSS